MHWRLNVNSNSIFCHMNNAVFGDLEWPHKVKCLSVSLRFCVKTARRYRRNSFTDASAGASRDLHCNFIRTFRQAPLKEPLNWKAKHANTCNFTKLFARLTMLYTHYSPFCLYLVTLGLSLLHNWQRGRRQWSTVTVIDCAIHRRWSWPTCDNGSRFAYTILHLSLQPETISITYICLRPCVAY